MYDYQKEQNIVIDGLYVPSNFLIIEYCSNGDLYEFMRNFTKHYASLGSMSKGLLYHNVGLLRQIFVQLLNALDSLHNQAGYAHMDIKLENILISENGTLKLADFGFSTPDKKI